MSFRRRTLALVAIVVSLFAGSAAAASAAQSWPVEPVPSPPARTGSLDAVSCATSDDCMAVGEYTDPHGVVYADSRHWNGQSWQRIFTPTPPATASAVNLNGVACPASGTCLAVGEHGYDSTNARKTWGLLWNGTSWRRVPTPNPAVGGSEPNRDLDDVACGSPTFCLAVGYTQGSGAAKPLAAVWNGSTWTASATPETRGLLTAVSCPAADRCIVIGAASKPFALQYLDGTWSTLPAPRPHGLSALSCVSATACTAVGSDGAHGVVQTWDGTTWQRATVPGLPHAIGTYLHDVSCASARRCVAVGEVADPNGKPTGHTIATALRWNGTTWSLMQVPTSTQQVASLSSVACPSEVRCVGVGYLNAGGQQPPAGLSATWDGGSGWSLQDPADRRGTSTGLLSSVSCTDDQQCIAVGQQQDATDRTVSLSEQRTAAGWSIVALPDVKGPNYLKAVSCSSAQDCLAVGQRGSIGELVFRWTGSAWTTVAPPSEPAGLTDVSCPATQDCVAVGQSEVDGNAVATVESWDGSSWTADQLALPPGAFHAELNGVDCPSATSCTAVGDAWYSQQFGYTARPIQARLHAGIWTLTANTTDAAIPSAVSCASASSCVAVGINSDLRAFAETYANGRWTVTAPLSPPDLENTGLAGVSCTSTTRCIGVGFFSGLVERKNYGGTLIESWDGHAWSVESATDPVDSTSPQLNGVSCTGSGTCRAAGGTGSPYSVPLVQSNG